MNEVKGMISLNPENGTISIKLDNGSYVTDHFPNGIKNWLEVELDVIKEAQAKEQAKETVSPFTVFYRYQNGAGFERTFDCYATSTENAITQFRQKYGYDHIRIMRTKELKR